MRPLLSTVIRTWSDDDPRSWQHLTMQAAVAESVGFDRVWLPDHVVFGANLDAYGDARMGGRTGGTQPTGPDGHWLEPMATIAYLAATTSTLRLATGILLAALRRPVVLAKSAATVDVLSGGRLDLGVGVGWQRAEYEAAGLSFEERGDMLDHTLRVCQRLWRENSASFDSDELTFTNIHQMPKPVAAGGVPVWVSGTVNRGAMDRLAEFGVGWIPWGEDERDYEDAIARMHRAMAERGRDGTTVQVATRVAVALDSNGKLSTDAVMARLGTIVELGVHDIRFDVVIPHERSAAEDVLGQIAALYQRVTR